jgi:selenide,water dikinase
VDKNLLVGFDTADDACVYKISEDAAIIQTVDFFPPVVDDPYLFGQIAAANALSDIYAMGGEPALALNLLCYPSCLPLPALREILAGGADKVREAGAIVAGGHSIEDKEPKFGLCVSGFARPGSIWTNAKAKEGDLLILTKALGSGINSTALKLGLLDDAGFLPTAQTMAALNRPARDAAAKIGVNACTDITGFGMAGHSAELAEASAKTVELFAEKMPLLPHAAEFAKKGVIPGGGTRNREYFAGKTEIAPNVPQYLADILFDPQTSGGLLLSVAEKSAKELLSRLREACPQAGVVGQVLPASKAAVRIV